MMISPNRPTILALAATLLLSLPLAAQEDYYSEIHRLEALNAQGTASTAERVELARLYIRAERFYEASKIADRVLADAPEDAAALGVREEARKGIRDIQEKKLAEAETLARSAGATPEQRLALADAYFEAGRYLSAAEVYKALPSAQQSRESRLRHARALAWGGRSDESERIYLDLIREQPDPELELEYGRVLSWMGATRPAIERLTKGYEATRSDESAVALANALAWSGDREAALKLLDAHLATNPNATAVRQLREETARGPELRLEQIDRLIELEPYNLALRIERARLLVDAGRFGEALRTITFVEDHSPNKIEGLADLKTRARELRARELTRVRESARDLDRRKPESAEQILALAKAYVGLEEYDEAIRLYQSYLRLRPDDTKARIEYARVLSWDRRYGPAEREYEKLLASQPDRADLRLEYAQILSYNDDYVGAMRNFREITDLSRNPRSHLYTEVPEKAHFNLGQIYRWFGWNEHAVEEQNSAIALDASYAPARRELDLVRHLRPASRLDGTYTFHEDSNDFRLHRFDLEAQKWTSQRTALEGLLGRHTFERGNSDVSATVVGVGGRYRYSDRWLARGRVGANLYDEGLGTRPFWALGAEWMPSLQSRAAFEYNHYDLVYDVFTLQSLGERPGVAIDFNSPISIDDLRGRYSHATGGHWSYLIDGSFGHISDGNNRKAAHGLLTYRILKAPFVAIKADGRYLSYDERTNRYWSPTDYKSIAGVLQVGQNIRERIFWTAELKYGRSYEGDRESDSRSGEVRVTLPINDAIDLVGDYGYGRSGRLEGPFGGSGDEFVNYWQRTWYVGFRLKKLFRDEERREGPSRYYFENRPLEQSPVLPPTGGIR